MPTVVTQTSTFANHPGCTACCGGECLLCGRNDYPYAIHPPSLLRFLESFTNTITGATGAAARWFAEGSYLGSSITLPLDAPIPFDLTDQEFCGFSGGLSITAYCCNNKVCVAFGQTFMIFGDCATFVTPACGVSDPACVACDPSESTFPFQFGWGVATVEMGEEVCDEDGFVSVDYLITLAFGEGTIAGTIHR